MGVNVDNWGSAATAPTTSFLLVGRDGGVDKRITIGTVLGSGMGSGSKTIVGGALTATYLILRSNEQSDKPVVSRLDGNDVPVSSLVAGTVHAFVNNSAASSDSYIYIESGASGEGGVVVGDTATALIGKIRYDHATNDWSFYTNASATAALTLNSDRTGTFRGNVSVTGHADNGVLDLITNDTSQQWRLQATQTSGAFIVRDATNSKNCFIVLANAPDNSLAIRASGNITIGGASTAASAAGALHIANGTAPSASLTDGVVIWSADTTAGQANLYARNEASGAKRLTGITTYLNSNQTKTTDTTLANYLNLQLETGGVYRFAIEAVLNLDGTGGGKWSVGGTATATAVRWSITVIDHATPAVQVANTRTTLGVADSLVGPTNVTLRIVGVIECSAGGNFGLQFAQQAASGSSVLYRDASHSIQQIG